MVNDERELDWLPSQQTEEPVAETNHEPWNTVGVPYKSNATEKTVTSFVRNAANTIMQKQCKIQFQNLRKEVVEDKIDASEARSFWKEKDRMSRSMEGKEEVRRSVSPEGEKPEDVIILKLDKPKGILLTPNDTVTLISLTESDTSNRDGKADDAKMTADDNEDHWNYEENWKEKDLWLWYSEHSRFPVKSKDGILAGMNHKAQIPRAQSTKYCKMCRHFFTNEKCCKCGTIKSSGYRSLDLRKNRENIVRSMDVETQKSRTNFFGNSGSYTLRCNLNPINRLKSNRKKFYLIPEPLKSGYFKNFSDSNVEFEDFVAKKRKFFRERANSGREDGEGDTRSDTVMW